MVVFSEPLLKQWDFSFRIKTDSHSGSSDHSIVVVVIVVSQVFGVNFVTSHHAVVVVVVGKQFYCPSRIQSFLV